MLKQLILREKALLEVAQKLDISPSKYKEARNRFESMRSYLETGKYLDISHQPEVYLQGSFRLGTEIRPYKDSKDADYDIDLVCHFEHKKQETDAKTLKHLIGNHLKAHKTYEKMLDTEGKRCWTLNYAEQDGVGFHMDILPSVQESLSSRANDFFLSSIAITNRDKEKEAYDWATSNPKGFAKWFFAKNRISFDRVKNEQKQILFESNREAGLFENREAVPDIHVKTPLQRAIQLLKRHRDVSFCLKKNEKCKPISMIITVLAARAYKNETTIYETIRNFIETVSRHAEQLSETFRANESLSSFALITLKENGEWYIPNPTNPGENFADRWHENDHARAKAFFQWVARLRDDFINVTDDLSKEHYKGILFPPEIRNISLASKVNIMSFDVPHRRPPEGEWPLKINYNASISASYNKNGWRLFSDGSSEFSINSGDQVERGKKICFKAHTNAPQPFQVYWQVVNTGKEADESHCLRGDFYASSGDCVFELGKKIRLEPTKYRGNHWVECFIVRNGVCIARSGEFVVRIV